LLSSAHRGTSDAALIACKGACKEQNPGGLASTSKTVLDDKNRDLGFDALTFSYL